MDAPDGFTPRECTGSMTPELLAAVQAQAGATRSCYEQALRKDPKLQGRLVFNLTFEEGGGISECSVAEDSLGSAELTECTRAKLLEDAYGQLAPQGGCLKVQLPLKFVPKQSEQPAQASPN